MAAHNILTAQLIANTTLQLIDPSQEPRGDVKLNITNLGANTVYYNGVNTGTVSNSASIRATDPPLTLYTSANVYIFTSTGTANVSISMTF